MCQCCVDVSVTRQADTLSIKSVGVAKVMKHDSVSE